MAHQDGGAERMADGGHTRPPKASLELKRAWEAAERRVRELLDRELTGTGPGHGCDCSEPWLARTLSRSLPPGMPVLLANSSPVRDWEHFAGLPDRWRPMHAFRGASGIDGTLSIACGLAEALGRLVLVSGDLALLHDSNGWLWRRQLQGRLTVVLIDNGGGGIFEQLPIRTDPGAAMDFERLFAMPQELDAGALAAVHGVPGRRVERREHLSGALRWALEQPLALVSVATDRRADALLRQRLRTMAAQDPATS
jgi:2-succinyl-5-enolpyruvyl-6-hydroxy-3-cyclohexene-1-carboxylate synthase